MRDSIRTNVTGAVRWTSNDWSQICITYSPTNAAIYFNGQALGTTTSGVAYWPDAAIRAGGFRIGSDSRGTNQARGRFENLQTYNYVLSAAEVASGYSTPCWSAIDVVLVIDRSGSMASNNVGDGLTKPADPSQISISAEAPLPALWAALKHWLSAFRSLAELIRDPHGISYRLAS
jgi:hypothetical protein